MSGISPSLEGLQRAEAQITESARRLSRLPAAFTNLLAKVDGGGSADAVDIVDISFESVALMQARNAGEANIAAIRSYDDVQQHLMSMFA